MRVEVYHGFQAYTRLGIRIAVEVRGGTTTGDSAELRVGLTRHGGAERVEMLFDVTGKLSRVYGAHHDQRDAFGTVPGAVEVDQPLARCAFDDGGQPDRGALRDQRARHEELDVFGKAAIVRSVAQTLLAQDHATLLVQLGREDEQPVRSFAHHRQAFVHQLGIVGGQLELEYGALITRACVGVRAEGHPQPLEVMHQVACRQVL